MSYSTYVQRLGVSVLIGLSVLLHSAGHATDWRQQYPEITLGVVTSENEADRLTRYQPVRAYLERVLGVKVNWRTATDYAGIIEGVKAKKIELARFGPASYAQCWIVTHGAVEPLLGEIDAQGTSGYHSVIVVKSDSPYKTLAFADPNSTSGYQAPTYFLMEQGYDTKTFFAETAFSGSHENSIMALLNGTFDAAATWWNSDTYSNPQRMEAKGMIPPGQWRVVWQSPKLPSSPWAMPTILPTPMRQDVTAALLAMPQDDPEAWNALTSGKMQGYQRVTHADYEPIVRMIQHNLKQRRSSN